MSMDPVTATITAILIGYRCGSVPFGVIVTRAGGAGDLRQAGKAPPALAAIQRPILALAECGHGGGQQARGQRP